MSTGISVCKQRTRERDQLFLRRAHPFSTSGFSAWEHTRTVTREHGIQQLARLTDGVGRTLHRPQDTVNQPPSTGAQGALQIVSRQSTFPYPSLPPGHTSARDAAGATHRALPNYRLLPNELLSHAATFAGGGKCSDDTRLYHIPLLRPQATSPIFDSRNLRTR
jgi:hypothetical protein